MGSAMSQTELASYVAAITAELGRLTKGRELALLAYFLDMARLEAETIVHRVNATEIPPEP